MPQPACIVPRKQRQISGDCSVRFASSAFLSVGPAMIRTCFRTGWAGTRSRRLTALDGLLVDGLLGDDLSGLSNDDIV